ncbi:MAG TPA: bifunctional diaminohydroxyphosphoribosylaminopyrimidine deaminase/5-amino-6-(5-phosphoribosylamino)uracil reductase RibD [Dehalococcoidia bacterium]|nr:bifunctional diaminohydroxyphosphoribosylaminopyrimidine deaminase/5-amino-6-(5-phosphoribosylamino)uracil reductase RibD [Dehalococcoidia bacterium]
MTARSLPPSRFMRVALGAAEQARGRTGPNPWVGAVVARGHEQVSVACTQKSGSLHAEAAALVGVDTAGATLYTTLEPCVSFPGKRTAPCTRVILAAGLARVVIALPDPDPNVAGRGIAELRSKGVHVEVGDGFNSAFGQLRPYVKHRRTGRPYVIVKFAASLDGRVASRSGDSQWITGKIARERGHAERARCDGIVVGSGTALADDPLLTARPPERSGFVQPVRIVLDSRGRLSPKARLFGDGGQAIVATTSMSRESWRESIAEAGGRVILAGQGSDGVDLDELMNLLGSEGLVSVLVEGGGTLIGSLLRGGHVDELLGFIAPIVIGGDGAPAVAGPGAETLQGAWTMHESTAHVLGDDVLIKGFVSEIEAPEIEW